MNVLLLGSTGLVGNKLLELLLADSKVERVHVLARRPCGIKHPKIKEFIGSLDNMDKTPEAFNVQSVFCCLGTTIKKAGSQEKFKLVDYHYPLRAAELAKQKNVESFCVITALGSNASSKIFYNQIKGELEEQLIKVGFNRLFIVRPSVIVGDRKESRPGEEAGIFLLKLLAPLFIGPLKKYAGSKVKDIANLMISLVKGERIHTSIEYKKVEKTQ